MTAKHVILSFFLFLFAGISSQAKDILNLYRFPANDAAVIATTFDDNSKLLDKARPYKQLSNWHYAKYRTDYLGYVKATDLSDGKVTIGTYVFTKANAESRILTTMEPDDIYSIKSHGEWVKLRITKTLVSYFKINPDHPNLGKNKKKVSGKQLGHSQGIESLEGYLQEAGPSIIAPYPYVLKDANGSRIAYINFENVLFNEPIWTLVGKKVLIYGKLEKQGKRSKLVIHATSILY